MPYNPGPAYRATSGYGNRTNPITGQNTEFHPGQDYAAPDGTSIPAASDGVVVYSGYNAGGYGNTVIIKSTGSDGDTYYTLYAHMNGNEMPGVGSAVTQGQTIGEVGSTGRSTGPHLHFEILNGDASVNNASGGPLGFTSRDQSIRSDPATFNNWSNGTPFGDGNALPPQGNGGEGGPQDICTSNGDLNCLQTLPTYDQNGALVREDWQYADGSHGTTIYEDDGSFSSIAHQPDGSTSTYANDGQGNATNNNYDANGWLTTNSWIRSDGSYGNNIYSLDGSVYSYICNADSSSTVSTYDTSTDIYGYTATDASGNWTHYDTTYGSNNSYDQTWSRSDGTHGQTSQAADGSTTQVQYNPDGSSIVSTFDSSTGAYGYVSTDPQGNWIKYETAYDNNGSYQQIWSRSDGTHGETTQTSDGRTTQVQYLTDGSITVNTYDANTQVNSYTSTKANGDWVKYETVYGANNSYNQTWTRSDGSHGESSRATDGSTTQVLYNPDGSSTVSTYDASNGVYGYVITDPQGNWTQYETTYGSNNSYDQTWSRSDGTYGQTSQAADGSTTQVQYNIDGSSTVSTYDASTHVYGYTATDSNGNWTQYETTYGANNSYDQSWTQSNGTHGSTTRYPDGSTSQSQANPDGSSTVSTYDASNGAYGYVSTDPQGNWTKYETTYGANNSYDQAWSRSDGTHGQTSQAADGSTTQAQYNPDGSSSVSTYDTSNGTYGYVSTDSQGNWTQYETTYGANNSFNQTWTRSDGTYGQTSQAADGSTSQVQYNPDGSNAVSTYDASNGVYGYVSTDPQGNWTKYETTYEGSGGYQQTWTRSDGIYGQTSQAADGSTAQIQYNPDGSSTVSTYNANTQVYGYVSTDANGNWIQYETTYGANNSFNQTWTRSDGTYGQTSQAADGSTYTSQFNADGSGTANSYDSATGQYGYAQFGSDNTVSVSGNGLILDADGRTININDNTSATISGGDNVINCGANDVLQCNGYGNIVNASASDALTIGNTGGNASDTLNVANAESITLGYGASADFTGNGNTIDLQGWNNVTSAGNTFNIQGPEDTISGTGNNIVVDNYVVYVAGNTGDVITGGGNTAVGNNVSLVFANDTGVANTVVGNGNTIDATGNLRVYGTGEVITGSGSEISAYGSATVYGDGNYINTGINGQVAVSGSNNIVNSINGEITLLGNDSSLVVYGDGNVLNAYGTNVTIIDNLSNGTSIVDIWNGAGIETSSIYSGADGTGEIIGGYGYYGGGGYGGGGYGGGGYGGGGYAHAGNGSHTSAGCDVNSISQYDLTQTELAALEALLQQTYGVSMPAPGSLGAPVLEGAKWDQQVITWSLANSSISSTTPFSGFMDPSYEHAVQEAFSAWAAVTPGISFQEVQDSSQSDIRIGFGSFYTAISGVIGDTSYQTQGSQLSSAIVRVEDPTQDPLLIGADGQLTYAGTGTTLVQDIEHEIGHALGFGHNTDPNSIMYFELTSANQTLDATDISGMNFLYGSGSSISSVISTSVDQLVQAMASFDAAPSAVDTSLTNAPARVKNYITLAPPTH